MKKELIKELNDIRRVMGLPLLVESGIIGTTTEFLTPIFRKLLNKGDDYVLDLSDAIDFFDGKVAELGLPKNTVDDIVDTFSDVNAYNALDVARKRNVFKVISEIDELSEPLGNKLLEKLMDLDSIESLDDINKSILSRISRDSNVTYDDALNQIFDGTNFSGMEPLFKKSFYQSYLRYQRAFVNSRRAIGLGKMIFKKIVPRNLQSIVNVLIESKKSYEVLSNEIESLFKNRINNLESLINTRTQIEDKLAAIERIADNSAKKVLDEIDEKMAELKKSGQISSSDYKLWKDDKKLIKEGNFWSEFIAPNYKELDEVSSGIGTFFRDGGGAFIPKGFKLSTKNGVKGLVNTLLVDNPDYFKRVFNFLLLGSAQTTGDILKRIIRSNPSKMGNIKWISETYVRAIAGQIIIPIANAIFWFLWTPTSEVVDTAGEWVLTQVNKIPGVDVNTELDWDIYETNLVELLFKEFKEMFKLGFDNFWEGELSTIEFNDLIPVLDSILLDSLKRWAQNRPNNPENPTPIPDADDVQVPEENTPNTGEVTAQQLQQLEDGVGPVESIGNGRYKDVNNTLYKFEDDKWVFSVDNGQTWTNVY